MPANVHQWLIVTQEPLIVTFPEFTGTDVWLYPDRIEDALCTPFPPACEGDPEEIIEEVIGLITGPNSVLPVSLDGDTIGGVIIETVDGTTVYIGFDSVPV